MISAKVHKANTTFFFFFMHASLRQLFSIYPNLAKLASSRDKQPSRKNLSLFPNPTTSRPFVFSVLFYMLVLYLIIHSFISLLACFYLLYLRATTIGKIMNALRAISGWISCRFVAVLWLKRLTALTPGSGVFFSNERYLSRPLFCCGNLFKMLKIHIFCLLLDKYWIITE